MHQQVSALLRPTEHEAKLQGVCCLLPFACALSQSHPTPSELLYSKAYSACKVLRGSAVLLRQTLAYFLSVLCTTCAGYACLLVLCEHDSLNHSVSHQLCNQVLIWGCIICLMTQHTLVVEGWKTMPGFPAAM